MKKITINLSNLGTFGNKVPNSLIKKQIKINKYVLVTHVSSKMMEEDIIVIYNKKQDKELYLKLKTVKKLVKELNALLKTS